MNNRKIKFEQSPTTIYPGTESSSDKRRSLIGKAYRIDLIASKEGQFAGFQQETLYIPEETMNSPEGVRKVLGEVAWKLLNQVKEKRGE